LSSEKGIDVLLRALEGSNYRLKIAGRGPEENALRQLVKDLKLSEQVDFLGQQGHQQLAGLLDGAIALTVPSIWYENMPLNILEALGRGCPVVASRIGGIPEIINHQVNGWLVESGDSSSWLAALSQASQADQIKFSQQAQASVEKYGWEKHFTAVESIYQQILQSRSHD
jgi:glycosyltransferase involved in cell wall biosynthesis